MDVITVTELLRNFRDYIGRVTHGGERFLLSRGGETVAELRGVASGRTLDELPDVLASLPRLSAEDADGFARDLETARAELDGAAEPRDPWAS